MIGRKLLPVRKKATAVALVMLLAATAVGQGQKPARSVCEIRSHPEKYLGKTVTVMGELYAEHHATHLSSPNCELATVFVESDVLYHSSTPTLELFRDGRARTFMCSDDRPFAVTVRGRFGTVNARGLSLYRIVVDEVISAAFVDGLSQHCKNRDVSPPDIKFSVAPMPRLSGQD